MLPNPNFQSTMKHKEAIKTIHHKLFKLKKNQDLNLSHNEEQEKMFSLGY